MIKFCLTVFISLMSYSVYAEDLSYSEETAVCDGSISFTAEINSANRVITLSDSASLDMNQYLSEKVYDGYKVASNVICQKLNGITYTGSAEEWQGFINNTISGLTKSGGENLQFTLVGTEDSQYSSTFENMRYVSNLDYREYTINVTFNKHKQVLYNLAVLDKKYNTMYTLGVSGEVTVDEKIKQEFERLVKSFIL